MTPESSRESLCFAATSDLAGIARGKAFPSADLERRLRRGVGWTPTNVQITCFNTIAESPFGALGDMLLIPDPAAAAPLGGEDAQGAEERLFIGDIVTLEGEPWEFCTRHQLRAALARLKALTGAELLAAFEHEFQLKLDAETAGRGLGFSLSGFRSARAFGESLLGALRAAGFRPEGFMKEYGAAQYEVTVAPEEGLRSADAAMILRELTRSVAEERGARATFTPIRDLADVGNGVHIHMSFLGDEGPLAWDAEGPGGMSKLSAGFAAGILKYLDAIVCLTAPSAISGLRLAPHRWSAAYNNLGLQDREAALRVCPVTAKDSESAARQYNLEYRAADAAASPHLALAAIVHAGCQGIEEGLAAPEITAEDLSLLSPEALARRGIARLPATLPEALERLEANATARAWFGDGFASVYLAHKRAEAAHLAGMDDAQKCAAYEEVY